MSIINDKEIHTAGIDALAFKYKLKKEKVGYAKLIARHLSGCRHYDFFQAFLDGMPGFQNPSASKKAHYAFYLSEMGTEEQKALYYRKSKKTGIRTEYLGKVGYASGVVYDMIAGREPNAAVRVLRFVRDLCGFFGYMPETEAEDTEAKIKAAFDGKCFYRDFVIALNHFGFRLSHKRIKHKAKAPDIIYHQDFGIPLPEARKIISTYKADPAAWPAHEMHTVYRSQRVIDLSRIKNV